MPYIPTIKRQINVAQLERMPTLHQRHFDNVKIETPTFIVALDRCTKADYENVPTPPDWPIIYETLINGCWVTCDRNGKALI